MAEKTPLDRYDTPSQCLMVSRDGDQLYSISTHSLYDEAANTIRKRMRGSRDKTHVAIWTNLSDYRYPEYIWSVAVQGKSISKGKQTGTMWDLLGEDLLGGEVHPTALEKTVEKLLCHLDSS